ncbi:fimbrillin family protein [Ochrovirga pacifica]|uniref:fimbrillin family protein n=1 Tax=Ochrovirga pacifica TaxID=1042376 RepID=UPI0002559AC2|nr:fimbrillin family protein [Ochrovirga pacifica]
MKRELTRLLFFLLMVSCSNDDVISNEVIKDEIFGEWMADRIEHKKVVYIPNGNTKDTISYFYSQADNISLELKITDNPKQMNNSGAYSYKGKFVEFGNTKTVEEIEKYGVRFYNINEWEFVGNDEINAVEIINNPNSNMLPYIDQFINFKIKKLTKEEFVLEYHMIHSFFKPSTKKEEELKVYTFVRKK